MAGALQVEHPLIATVPLSAPSVNRTIGPVERHNGRPSPAAIRFREILVQEWATS